MSKWVFLRSVRQSSKLKMKKGSCELLIRASWSEAQVRGLGLWLESKVEGSRYGAEPFTCTEWLSFWVEIVLMKLNSPTPCCCLKVARCGEASPAHTGTESWMPLFKCQVSYKAPGFCWFIIGSRSLPQYNLTRSNLTIFHLKWILYTSFIIYSTFIWE